MAKKFLKFPPVFLLLVAISSCTSQPVMNVKNMPLPRLADGSALTRDQVRKAIIAGCRRRRWVAQPKEDGLITASILVRANRAEVDIRYDETTFSILYKDSDNLDYFDGHIHRNYNRWISYLYEAILAELYSST